MGRDGFRRLFRLGAFRSEVQRDLDDELAFHFEQAVADLESGGLEREEAVAAARRRFGDERAYRDALERIASGRVRMREWSERMDAVVLTLTHAVRSLRRAPGLTAAIVVILALGIGANAVMFGVVDRLLLSPPQHVVDWEETRHLYVERTIFNGERVTMRSLTYPDYQDLRDVSGWSHVAAYTSGRETTVGAGDATRRVTAAGASASLFPLLGVQPALGRFYTEAEDALGAEPTAVLAHEYWERDFGADPSVLGSSLQLGKGTYSIVGVAPRGFTGAELGPVDVWVPITRGQEIEEGGTYWAESRGWWWLQVAVRLAPGATDEATLTQATALHLGGREDRIARGQYDPEAEMVSAPIIAGRGPNPAAEIDVARWLSGVSTIVLLIACFNVANLLLVRGVRLQREVAVRLALGVSRSRLLAQLLVESALFAGLGAVVALGLALAVGPAIHDMLLPNVAFTDRGIGGRLVAFTIVAALGAAFLAGVIPGLQSGRQDVGQALRAGGRGVAGRRSRVRISLLIGQAALSVVLLVGAGLFVRSLDRADRLDLGFDAREVAVVELEWTSELPPLEREAVYDELAAELRRFPGVRAAGFTHTIPFWTSIVLGQPRVPGVDSIPLHPGGGPYMNKVSSGYFEAMGLEIVHGRSFEAPDDVPRAPPVIVLSESLARAIWPEGEVLGRCLYFDSEVEAAPCTEVVGVVENHRRQALVEDDEFLYFLNRGHPAEEVAPEALMVGVDGDVAAAIPLLREKSRTVSSEVRFAIVNSLQEYIDPSLRSWKLGAAMFTLFGVLALVVAAWGLYSVLAFDVALRRRELGIRAALGAGRDRIVALVLRQALALVAGGVVIGLGISWWTARFVEPLLFEVSARDPMTYGIVAATLLVIAGAAGSFPAWRATRVDPTEALRAD